MNYLKRLTSLNHSGQTRMPAYNTGLAKVAVQSSADSFGVNQSLVLRINICVENRHLRQARKRYLTFLVNNKINQNLLSSLFVSISLSKRNTLQV